VAYTLDVPQAVKRYSLTSGNDSPGRDPQAWQLQGSDDGATWTTLDTQTGQSFAARQATNTYTVAGSTAYSRYRLLFTANHGDPITQLSDWSISDGSDTLPPPIPGGFAGGFSPGSGRGFAEGSTTQYSWMVYDDAAKLASLMGGKAEAARRLDAFFSGTGSTHFDPTNEPDIQTPWMYDYLGRPASTQATVRRIVNQNWTNTTGGITGNDDLGTMSAWNVWASLGLYPYNPARAELVLASPLFPHVEIRRPGGQAIAIDAPGADADTMYVSALKVDGADSDRPWVPASLVADGGTLSYTLSATPSAWGAGTPPLSLSDPPRIDVSASGTTLAVHASDAMSGLDGAPTCTLGGAAVPLTAGGAGTWTGTVAPSASQTAVCTATNAFGTSATATTTVWPSTTVGGTVPATLALTLGPPASFGAFAPGVDHTYGASTSATVTSTAGNAALTVSGPLHLTNGSFTLPDALQVEATPSSWSGPVSNDPVAIAFHQHIGATDPLRTGAYTTTLTFTLSTTAP
jgi:hypothetical protein